MIWTISNNKKYRRTIRNNWYNLLINHIPKSIRKTVANFKDKVVNIFKTNTAQDSGKQATYWRKKHKQIKI